MTDEIVLEASVPEIHSPPQSLLIVHNPSPKTRSDVKVTLERLQVDEGGCRPILTSHLDLSGPAITMLLYNITHPPSHGRIDVHDAKGAVIRHNATYFTSNELRAERVSFCHDNSESRKDRLSFLAISNVEEDFQFAGMLHVDINLINDNSPIRNFNKVFNVVSGGERLLTGRDLKYSDADLDTQSRDIVYTRRGIPNGGLYSASDRDKAIFDFTQEDLDEGRVLFRHDGEEFGKIGLWVTDGKFFDNGILEVKASPPYVEIVNNTKLVIQQGSSGAISSQELAVDTNTNTWSDRLDYQVTEGPGNGYLMVLPQAEPLDRFSQLNLDNAKLYYSHDGSQSVKDFFR